ncbi:MAG: DUF4215 domain-containing protein, partial [Myxococcota bacterium]
MSITFSCPRALLVAGILLASPAARAADLCFNYGSVTAPGLQLAGSASFVDGEIELTPDINSQAGSFFSTAPLSTAGDLSIFATINLSTSDWDGADGIAFVMQNSPDGAGAVGLAGEGIGYQGITPSVVVEFDTYENGFDPSWNHVAIMQDGDPSNHLVTYTPDFLMENEIFNVWIDYVGASSTINVYLSLGATRPPSPSLTATLDFPAILGSTFYAGFTSSTGGLSSRHAVRNLVMTDGSAAADVDGDGAFDACDADDDNDCVLDGTDEDPADALLPAGAHCPDARPCEVLPDNPIAGTCVPPVCGDGAVDSGEACDDGNLDGCDGCSWECQLEVCGNGTWDCGEYCDDGNTASGDGCDADCMVEPCGDGWLDLGEQCDDYNLDACDGCSATCQIEECGNGIVDCDEKCDDGNIVSGDGCDGTCVDEYCGDGVLNDGADEQCDDGNIVSGDGCDGTCV